MSKQLPGAHFGGDATSSKRARSEGSSWPRGWPVVPFDKDNPVASSYRVAAVEEFATDNGPADYGLCAADAVLGVVEAKKVSVGPQGVVTQSER